jgi:FeS assembly protein SufB
VSESSSNVDLEKLANREYQYGFVTDIESDTIPPGLDEGVVRLISDKKNEPEWLLEWRLKALRRFLEMVEHDEEPTWAKVEYPKIDYQALSYYSAPKPKPQLESLDEVDPELLRTYEKLGIAISEQKRLAGVAVDAVFDSVSVATTFKGELEKQGIIFCSFSEAVQRCPDLVKKYLGSVVPYSDNLFATLNSAVFSDGSFAYIPKGVRCPMELSTYFRMNTAGTGQFERTLLIADEGAHVSYLEGCTAPMRDENQLHAAVVELVALDDAEIKYSTVQNWYPGDKEGRGGIFNFVTKRGACRGKRSKISWTQVETGSAITWKYPSCILQGDDSVGVFYSLEGHFRGPRPAVLPGPGANRNEGRERAQLFPVRLAAAERRVRRPHLSVPRGEEPHSDGRARGYDQQDRRGPALLLPPARTLGGGCYLDDREWLLQGGAAGAADGVCRGGPEPAGTESRGKRWLMASSCCFLSGSLRTVSDMYRASDASVERRRRPLRARESRRRSTRCVPRSRIPLRR